MKSLAVWLGSAALLTLALALALIGGLALFKYSQIQAAMHMPPPPEQPISIMAVAAKELTIRSSTTMIGTVLSPRSIMLSNEIAGTVSAVHFQPGQIVDENQVLVELDTNVERAQLEAVINRKTLKAPFRGKNRTGRHARRTVSAKRFANRTRCSHPLIGNRVRYGPRNRSLPRQRNWRVGVAEIDARIASQWQHRNHGPLLLFVHDDLFTARPWNAYLRS